MTIRSIKIRLLEVDTMTRRFLAIRPNDVTQPFAPFTSVDRMMRDMLRAFGEFSSDMGYAPETDRVPAVPRGDFYRKDGKVTPSLFPASIRKAWS